MFLLSQDEAKSLRSQSVISKKGRGGRRNLPFVFTEHKSQIEKSETLDRQCHFLSLSFIPLPLSFHRTGLGIKCVGERSD
jgi:hypothetical protein